MNCVHQGSVKDLFLDSSKPDVIYFRFSDRVSLFDFGALPDRIPHRGQKLHLMAQHFFELFGRNGLSTAYVKEDSSEKNGLAMRMAKHPLIPETKNATLEFIPLELIFRWGCPKGSSLIKRGLAKAGERFDSPMLEFSTKIEDQDRMLSEEEAKKIVLDSIGEGLAFEKISQYLSDAANVLKVYFKGLGFELWDGKIECAWDPEKNEIVLVDAITIDELRLSIKGLESVPLSKELLRMWYSQTTWSHHVKRLRKEDPEQWRERLDPVPRLGDWRVQKLFGLYEAFSVALEEQSSTPVINWIRNDEVAPKVFVLGGGGREAAQKWRLKNEGCEIVESYQEADVAWVSMDGDLEKGQVDQWQKAGVWTYGPTRSAAELEWSKTYGRQIASEVGIPCPRFSNRLEEARSWITEGASTSIPVVKLDALAGGKGVILPNSLDEFETVVADLSQKGELLFEERCEGPEASIFFHISSGFYGSEVQFLGSAQDFKRRFAGDEGPNTGGMGAYVPNSSVSDDDLSVFQFWAEKVAEKMSEEGKPYHGILYMGLMKDREKGWVLIEFNSRFGDPETQALVLSWAREKRVLRNALALDLKQGERVFSDDEKAVVCLALVRPEYPGKAPSNFELADWMVEQEDCQLFRSQSIGGRVAYLVAEGSDRSKACERIFQELLNSPWKEKLEWRPDIIA